MAGERTPDQSPSSRSGSSDDDISLREHMQRQIDMLSRHIDVKIADLTRLLDERYATQTKAIEKAEIASEKRFEGVNEFRAQLSDQARTFMPRQESISRHDRTTELIQAFVARHENDMATINKRLDLTQGASTGIDRAWGYLIAAVVLAGTVIGIVLATR